MHTNSKITTCLRKITTVFTLLLLVWMTVSVPLSYNKESDQIHSIALNEEVPGPATSMNEDTIGFSEYLPDQQDMVEAFSNNLKHTSFISNALFLTCDGKLLSPPPEC